MKHRRSLAILRTPLGVAAGALLGFVPAIAVLAPLLWTRQAGAVDVGQTMQGVSAHHVLGTDLLGRDILYRVLVATRISVAYALLATAIGVLAGLILGSAPLLFGQRIGRLITAAV